MNEVDRFFADEAKTIWLESRAVVRTAARELEADVKRQIRQKFNNPSLAFISGIKITDFENASYVRLSPILSAHADEPGVVQGNPTLWILLPDGIKNGFRRIGKGFDWSTLKRRYGNRLSFVPVSNGHVVLYRQPNGRVVPVYKLQQAIQQKQKIDFYSSAEKIAKKYV